MSDSNVKTSTQLVHPFTYVFSEEELAEKARDELGETPEKVREGISAMKEYIKKHNLRTSVEDEYLLTFLRVKKFRHEDSCKALEAFTNSLGAYYKKSGPLDAGDIKSVLRKNVSGILPFRDPGGRCVWYYRYGIAPKENLPTPQTSLTSFLTICHIMMSEPSAQTHGMNWIVDARNMSMREVYDGIEYGLMFCKLMFRMAIRVHRIDIMYDSMVFRILCNALQPFLPPKLLGRMHLHGTDYDALLKNYDKSTFPDEFEGSGGPISNDHWIDQVDEAVKKLLVLQKKAVEES